MDHIEKFQEILKELFQFDAADLDFGIYRIMNYKRDVIERFIQEDLPRGISEELAQGALAGQTQAAGELEAARKKVLEIFDDAIDAAGNLIKYRDTKPGKAYLAALEKAKSAKSREGLEAAIYNHLYAFFSRYYQDGDIISKRRYSKRERYAIPYNGEEVALYWANRDQYYIKTGEYFADYAWKATNGVAVHFKLTAADVDQNNVKGDKRFFLPQPDEIVWNGSARRLTIPFEFRPLNEQEAIAYSGKNQQEAIIAKAVENIPKQRVVKTAPLALAALEAEKRCTGDGKGITHLEHHLRRYTWRNTSDFFIHKDLNGFLSRELDFYLKNEVLNLEEMEAAGIGLSEGLFQMMRLVKKVGGRIIEFLSQIEEFQKMLWEKRKFITETFYCITIGHIPEEFYPEIAACEAQWEEWKVLFSIDEGKDSKSKQDRRMAFLKTHPALVIDTRHFLPDFIDSLLSSFDDLDEAVDGLLINSENWQALNLLTEKYREQVECIYIDPPYNSPASEIPYKNDYKHSAWLSLMSDRIATSARLMDPDSRYAIAIDDYEQQRLSDLLDDRMRNHDRYTIVVNHHPQGGMSHNVSRTHEYMFMIVRRGSDVLRGKEKSGEIEYRSFMLSGPGSNKSRTGRPNSFYAVLIDETKNVIGVEPPPPLGHKYAIEKTDEGYERKYPLSPVGEEKVWCRSYKSACDLVSQGRIIVADTGTLKIAFDTAGRRHNLMSNWTDSRYNAGPHGTALIADIIGDRTSFAYPKSIFTVTDAIEAMTWQLEDPLVLDFFAGSGTTGHAVINLNREDGGRRKFILVEMAQYFDTVLLQRIKKIALSPEWKDGKPKRMATAEEAERSPRIVKVIRLESYEDALNNIAFDEPSGRPAMQFEDYLLGYMLQWETRKSETLLNVEKISEPFSYKLHIRRNGATRVQAVDLPETFAYLLGLHVRKRQAISDNDRRYLVYRGVTREGRKVAAVWRETKDWKEKDYKRDKEFVAAQKLAEGADEVYVNGDSYIPGARALESLFKARMFAEVEA